MHAAADVAARLANRALLREDTLRARLAAHAGAVLRVTSGALHAQFAVGADGALAQAADDAVPTLTLTILPLDVPALLHDPSRFAALTHADGDAALAQTLAELATTVPWFVEQAFGDAFGAVIGQRLASTGHDLLGLPLHVAERLRASAAGYVQHEVKFGVSRDDADAFAAAAADATARTDALGERIARLPARRK